EAADGIERRRSQRAADAEAVRDGERRHAEATVYLEMLVAVADLAVRATLTRLGFRQHARGRWRKSRGANPTHPVGGEAQPRTGPQHHREGPPGRPGCVAPR